MAELAVLTCLGICRLHFLVTFSTGLSFQKDFPVPLQSSVLLYILYIHTYFIYQIFSLFYTFGTSDMDRNRGRNTNVVSVMYLTLEKFCLLFSDAGVPGWGSSLESPNTFEDTASRWAEAGSSEGGLSHGSWELHIPQSCWFRESTWLSMNPCVLFLDGTQCMS